MSTPSLTQILSAITTTDILSASICVATWLTWMVYRRIEGLMRQNNAILEKTNTISQGMLAETRRSWEVQFTPLLIPHLQRITPDGGSVFSDWKIENRGAGTAFGVRVIALNNLEEALPPIEPGAVAFAGAVRQESVGTSSDFPSRTAQLTMRYRDLLGNEFETRFEQGNIRVTQQSSGTAQQS